MYFIAEFTEESMVGIVARCWTNQENGVQKNVPNLRNVFKYLTNVSDFTVHMLATIQLLATFKLKEQKKEEIPDEDKWISREMCVFANISNVSFI